MARRLPAEVSVDVDAGPGEALFAVPRLRAEAPPEPPAALTNWIDKESLRDSSAPSPVLKDNGPAWVIVEQPDGSKGMAAKVLPAGRGARCRAGLRDLAARCGTRGPPATGRPRRSAAGTPRWPAPPTW